MKAPKSNPASRAKWLIGNTLVGHGSGSVEPVPDDGWFNAHPCRRSRFRDRLGRLRPAILVTPGGVGRVRRG